MKTLIKFIFLLLFVALSSHSYAQLRVSNYDLNPLQTVQGSSAFIDASSSLNYNPSTYLGKGLVFPRVDLTTFILNPASAGTTFNFPTFFDGMIVYNTATSGSAKQGSTEGTLSRGFWYYDNESGDLTGGTWKPLCGCSGSGSSQPPTSTITLQPDPTTASFAAAGETRTSIVPHDSPECTAQNPAYSFAVTNGAGYLHISVTDAATGTFSVTMDPNTGAARTATVRITDNCSQGYRDLQFTQDGVTATPCTDASITAYSPDTKTASIVGSGSVTLSVTPNGTPSNFVYQWYNGTSAISGATSHTYAASATGTYHCTVQASCGGAVVTSDDFTVSLISIPDDSQIGAGSLSGRTCFDIAVSNDDAECGTLSSRSSNKADFTQTSTNTQTYTFTAAAAVTNVRFAIQDPEGALLSSDPLSGTLVASLASGSIATLTIHFKTNLNSSSATPLIVGRDRTGAAKVTINIIYNNGSTDVKVPLTANIQDCMCCGAMTTSGTFLQFMCHNLGADESLDPFTYVVGNADGSGGTLGWLFQWGRPADGHQLRTSGTTMNLSSSDTPGNNLFIINNSVNLKWDWRNPQNDQLWNSGTETAPKKAANDPCPSGWRVPTQTEWDSIDVASNWTWTTANGGGGMKVGSALYLPAAGYRDGSYDNGVQKQVGTGGGYWASSPPGTVATSMPNGSYPGFSYYGGDAIFPVGAFSPRSNGLSVRCIAE